jgi:starch phosphorylase
MEILRSNAASSAAPASPPDPGQPRPTVPDDPLARAILDNLIHRQAHSPEGATANDWYMAVAYTVRDRLVERWLRRMKEVPRDDVRVVAYMSAEFLTGSHLENHLLNLDLLEPMKRAVAALGKDLAEIAALEEEPGLGHGGLGRLAACFMDSLATLEVPAIGYGIRYEFGIFDQVIQEGAQLEIADRWLAKGNPWEIARPHATVPVGLGGRTEPWTDGQGRARVRWIPERVVTGLAYDTLISGYRVDRANMLRLWKAEAVESFDFQTFNRGDYVGAVDQAITSETISKVLYPNDELARGKQLRLEQQYFFVACSLADMLRYHRSTGRPVESFAEKFVIQLNDTHPSIAVAELYRLLLDEEGMDDDAAWDLVRRAFGYTNHTLMPEALERWPLPLFRAVLPRHLQLIEAIDARLRAEIAARFPGDDARAARMAILDRGGEGQVRMAHLASAGSFAINGVARLHTELLARDVLRDFFELWPAKFTSVTNGVTPRRFVALADPELSALLTGVLGDSWLSDVERALPALEAHAADPGFRAEWRAIKRRNKERLAAYVREHIGLELDPDALFDIQCKRFHEYKRQHLNALHVITAWQRLKRGEGRDLPPRAVLFSGKAAPGYFMAKLMIRLINGIARVVNQDPETRDHLRVAFVPNFNVTVAQKLYPAGELSEQISTAGKEASGTGNMKFALNGALTIGTLDGANVEILEAVGEDNFFLFGLTTEEAAALRDRGYQPRRAYEEDGELQAAIDAIARGDFSGGDGAAFRPLVEHLLERDDFLLLADYRSYVDTQARVLAAYRDPEEWTRRSILNTARCGRFSSDRSIREYCAKIWKASPVPA